MDARIRPARPDDVEDVVAFTRDTWSDRETGDYLPDVFPQWVKGDDPGGHSLVADVDGRAVGTLQACLLPTSHRVIFNSALDESQDSGGTGY
jgi:hypothetical protein